MLITYLREEYPNFLNEQPNVEDLTKFYKASKLRFDEDPVFKKVAQETVPKL